MANLIEGLQAEMNRVRELQKDYENLPGGVGQFAVAFMKLRIKEGEEAIASGDALKMAGALQELQDFTE